MELDLVSDVYEILRSYVDPSDIDAAADEMVKHLMDAGYSADEIARSCEGHDEVISALDAYGQYETDRQGGEEYDSDDDMSYETDEVAD